MKLTKLELSGFKSFADHVTLDFGEGVTAIVGPNGCGKSNVSDAVRWVLGEQSARLLRGGKMEDVIFQGAAGRRPVNVTEVSLFLDNGDGQLPIAYQEVQVTRRLSRSGQSEYLLNKAPVRLRDIQDLLRGTGLGSDAGVVIEAKMIDLLLSDRAGERRSLFEEAAGIGLYRDRKLSTERRLEETAQDLQRVEDLIAEVQSQIRSLARQKGKAERHGKLTDDKFAVDLTLASVQLQQLQDAAADMRSRHEQLVEELPAARSTVTRREEAREESAGRRGGVESQRTEIARRLTGVQVEIGKLDGDLGIANERLANAAARRLKASEERTGLEARAHQARREGAAAEEEVAEARAEREAIQAELTARAQAEDEVRQRLAEHRDRVRMLEAEAQRHAHRLKSLEGERSAVEDDLADLREQIARATSELATLRRDLESARERERIEAEEVERASAEARRAVAEADRSRHAVSESRELEASSRAALRRAEESVAQLQARRQALQDLERDRVGLAPGAAALLAARERFGDAVLGPLSDFIRTGREDAALAERLLGEWIHAVVLADEGAVEAIRAWHTESGAGAVVLLPGGAPATAAAGHPLEHRLRVESKLAAGWVGVLLGGAEVLDDHGRALRRASGAVFLSSTVTPSGPLQRRAELESLTQEVVAAEGEYVDASEALSEAATRLTEAEETMATATAAAEQARDGVRGATARHEDAQRSVARLERDSANVEAQLARLTEREDAAQRRLHEIDQGLTEADLARLSTDEELGTLRSGLTELEGEQEAAREARVRWQVRAAHVDAQLQAAQEKIDRASAIRAEADEAIVRLAEELTGLERDTEDVTAQQARWKERRAECRVTALELEAAAADAESALTEASEALAEAERGLSQARSTLEELNEEHHRIELKLAEVAAERRAIVDRIETEWRRPLDSLLSAFDPLDLDLETLRDESTRIREALERLGPVNPLAVEEHAEESKRLEFLTSQRDDLVAARQSLAQAIREIDGTARAMFVETFEAIRANFTKVFQTLFGGGECDLRLAQADDPLESEIEIHAAPRGKRTQRIHLLSSGERTLVAVSLLFSIYLTKPSPFCLMDEVDAPLDDANVGRFTRLLDEFKVTTQFIVITHNPRTMHAADAVYGVTMQEPGVSTIVGVRLTETQPELVG